MNRDIIYKIITDKIRESLDKSGVGSPELSLGTRIYSDIEYYDSLMGTEVCTHVADELNIDTKKAMKIFFKEADLNTTIEDLVETIMKDMNNK